MQDTLRRPGLLGAWALALAACSSDTPTRPALPDVSLRRSAVATSVHAPNGYAADTLAVGETTQLTATLRSPGKKTRTVAWTSRNAAVASVTQSGLVTGVAGGATFVVASNGADADSARITVLGAAPPPPPSGSCPSVTDWTAKAQSSLVKPGYLQSVTDATFGVTITRVSGDPGTAIGNGMTTQWPQVVGPAYAKTPAWSADGAYLLLSVSGALGGGVSLVLDGHTYQPIRPAGPAPSYVWHPSTPDVLIGVSGGGSVVTHNVRTGATTTAVSVSGYTSGWLGKGEGNPSNDGRYVPVSARRTSDSREVVYVADVVAGTKSPDLDVVAQSFSDLDWVGVSQSGRYLFLFGTIGGAWGRAKVYDRATLALVHYWSDYPTGHSDLGLDAAGADVLFGAVTLAGAPQWVARNLTTGALTTLSPGHTTNWHASTRNTKRPGWGLGTTNNAAGSPVDGQMYAVRLDGSQGVERWGYHRSAVTAYDAHPFAVPSPDGRKVVFRSNWGAAAGPVQAYVVSCP
jgi:hypothetical protein